MKFKPPFNQVEHKRVKMPESLVDLSPVARSLNRIYQEISTNGAQEETLKNLSADIKCVEKHFGINAKAAAAAPIINSMSSSPYACVFSACNSASKSRTTTFSSNGRFTPRIS